MLSDKLLYTFIRLFKEDLFGAPTDPEINHVVWDDLEVHVTQPLIEILLHRSLNISVLLNIITTKPIEQRHLEPALIDLQLTIEQWKHSPRHILV